MNKKAILASLFIAASSTAALADPYFQAGATVQANVAPSVVVRDHRDNDARDNDARTNDMPRDVDGQFMRDHRRLPVWSVVSSSDKLMGGRDVIRLSTWKKYSELKLEATSGKLQISRVQIRFADGHTQLIRTNAALGQNLPALTINLDGGARSIASIAVYGTGNRRASFEVLGA
jgi:hypothetical protein